MNKESNSFNDLTIIVPTYNEVETIATLIDELQNLYPGVSVIVADDVSSDGTQEIVRGYGEPVALLERVGADSRGITASVIDGINICKTPHFLVMDGDMQHPPKVVAELYRKIQDGADLVAGARNPYNEDRPFHRSLITFLATLAAYGYLFVRGIRVADPMSGLFAGRTDLVQKTISENLSRFEPCGYKILFDLLRAIDPKVKVEQVFYDFGVRPGGHSKLRAAHMLYFIRSLFK